jgi:hypothetical protein
MNRATFLVVVIFAALAIGTAEIPDPEGAAHDQVDQVQPGTATHHETPPADLPFGTVVRGEIDQSDPLTQYGGGHADRYLVELTAGTTYTADMRVEGWESYDADRGMADPDAPGLALIAIEGSPDHPGAMMRTDDRMLPGVFSRAHLTPTTSGTYTLLVRAEIPGPTGSRPTFARYEIRFFDRDLPLCPPSDCFHVPDLPQ